MLTKVLDILFKNTHIISMGALSGVAIQFHTWTVEKQK